MRSCALDYFSTQPWYVLQMQPKVKREVEALWLQGYELDQLQRIILPSKICVESVTKFKSYVMAAVSHPDINGEKTTKDILRGFLDYVERVYKELEAKIDDYDIDVEDEW